MYPRCSGSHVSDKGTQTLITSLGKINNNIHPWVLEVKPQNPIIERSHKD